MKFNTRLKIGKKKQVETSPAGAASRSYVVAALHHIGARESQQDSYAVSDLTDQSLVLKKGILAVVADGMGGLKNGAEISGIVTYSFKESFSNTEATPDVPMELLQMLYDSNRQVNDFVSHTGGSMSGSTVVAVIIRDGRMYFLSVGDSRIYLLREGRMLQLNREHVYATELYRKAAAGEISPEEAYSDSQRNSLTSYIGMKHLEEVDFSRNSIEMQVGDTLLLMSDGVFGTLTEQEIAEAVEGYAATQAAANLERSVLGYGKRNQDNFTALIIKVQ